MRRLLRFFLVGPGAILTVIFIGLGVCWLINAGQDRQAEEARKRQVQRELGNINPSDDVDKSQAAKEVTLSNRRLNPVLGSQPTSTPDPINWRATSGQGTGTASARELLRTSNRHADTNTHPAAREAESA